ncbi:MAG: monovalent cation/H(+) antiporter subunit G [Lachnospiraceae bacterium]|nr:monovalent cation/H(+) antiporter subunit G [Lachnospiraceae bacterium]
MTALEWLRFLLGSAFTIGGIVAFGISIVGVFRFKYAMNRLHAAAIGDTMGIGCFTIGMMILNGFNITSVKMLVVILFLWFASPTSSHLVARMEVSVDDEPEKHYAKKQLEKEEKGKEEDK